MKIKIKYKNMGIFFALLVLLSEKVLWRSEGIMNIGYYLAALAIFAAAVLLGGKLIVQDYGVLLVVICQSWIVCSNIINGSTYLTTIRSLNTISLCMLMYYGIRKNNAFMDLLADTLLLICTVDQIWTLYQIFVLHKSEIGGYGIFLHKNAHVIMYIGVILFQWLKCKKNHNGMPRILKMYIAFCFIMASFILHSASSSVAMGVLILLMIFENRITTKLYNVLTLLIINLFLFVTIVIQRLDSVLLSLFVERVLKRNLNFTGRTVMWDDTLASIKKLPFWGFGDDFLCVQHIQGMVRYSNCHNYILHIIVSGGWIYALLVFLVYITCYKRMRGYENQRSARVVMYYLTANVIIGISEIVVNMSSLLFPILLMGICIRELEDRDCSSMAEEKSDKRKSAQ